MSCNLNLSHCVHGHNALSSYAISLILFDHLSQDADLLAHDVYEPGSQSLQDIVTEFGDDILRSDATIDRKKLGAIVFSDNSAMSVSLLYHEFLRSIYSISLTSSHVNSEARKDSMASRAHQD